VDGRPHHPRKIMENPTPFDLNAAIRHWQHNLAGSSNVSADSLEELGSHLRASVQKLKADGLSEEAAFNIATRRIGERGPLEREFAKLKPAESINWPVFLFCSATGIYLFRLMFSVSYSLRIWTLGGSNRPADTFVKWELLVLFLVILASFLSWRLIMGRWKGLGACILSRVEGLSRDSFTATLLGSVLFAGTTTFLPVIAAALAVEMNHPILIGVWDWTNFTGWAALNLNLAVSLVLLARRGFRTMSPGIGGKGRQSAE
jgi:hypothetical protein